MEAAMGVEPINSGFADHRLTAWLRRRFYLSIFLFHSFLFHSGSIKSKPPAVKAFNNVPDAARENGAGNGA
jgi:hypothetical protein